MALPKEVMRQTATPSEDDCAAMLHVTAMHAGRMLEYRLIMSLEAVSSKMEPDDTAILLELMKGETFCASRAR